MFWLLLFTFLLVVIAWNTTDPQSKAVISEAGGKLREIHKLRLVKQEKEAS